MADKFILRMGDTSKAARVARFDDDVSLRHAKAPLHMWEELEPMIEEDAEKTEESKPTEFRRRRRRHTFRRKSRIILRDSKKKSDGGSLMLEGTPDATTSRYALLQASTSENGEKILSVIPVENWWNFRKPAVATVTSLDEVDNLYEQKRREQIAAQNRYTKLYERLGRRAPTNGEQGAEDTYAEEVYGTGNGKKSAGKSTRPPEPSKIVGLGDAGEDLEEVDEWKGTFKGEGEEYLHNSNDEGDLSADDSAAEKEHEKPANTYDVIGGFSSEDSEADEDEEDEEEDEGGNEGPLDELGLGSRQVRELLQQQAAENGDDSSNAAQPMKRARESSPSDEEAAKKARSDDLVKELTEANVRRYLLTHGSKMRTRELLAAFKKVVKRDADKTKIREIISKLTIFVEDPVLGKVLMLKNIYRKW